MDSQEKLIVTTDKVKTMLKTLPTLRRLERLTIYSYLDLKEYASKIRCLSKSERKLTQNSAIASENKSIYIKS